MTYRQEYFKGQAEDQGRILGTDERVESPYGAFTKGVVTRDTTPLDTKVQEYKVYAPGIGLILALDISGGSGREELVSVEKVADDAALGPLGNPDA